MSKRILLSGLGGGLDIVNASVFYFAAKNSKKNPVLGSVKSAPLTALENYKKFSDNGALVNGKTQVNYKSGGFGYARYAEPAISEHIKQDVFYFAERFNDKKDTEKLRKAIIKAKDLYNIENMIFVDGGGDSLIFLPEDASEDSEYDDPFSGGDANTQKALSGIKNTFLAVVSVGLDIRESAFQKNRKILEGKGAYYGRVNLLTGEEDGYKLQEVLEFKGNYLEEYYRLAERVMVLNEKDLDDTSKKQSHTGVVTYNALRGNFGDQSTFIRFSSSDQQGFNRVNITTNHCWCYFFDASVIHELKVKMNKTAVK